MEFRVRTTCDREVVFTRWDTAVAGPVVRFAIVEEPGADPRSDEWCDEFDLIAGDPAVEMLAHLLMSATQDARAGVA